MKIAWSGRNAISLQRAVRVPQATAPMMLIAVLICCDVILMTHTRVYIKAEDAIQT
jgi:hypothetical protein